MTDDYKPFPEIELRALAEHFDTCASWWGEGSDHFEPNVKLNRGRAVMLRNAIACYEALRVRCLESETRYRVLSGVVEKYAGYNMDDAA